MQLSGNYALHKKKDPTDLRDLEDFAASLPWRGGEVARRFGRLDLEFANEGDASNTQ